MTDKIDDYADASERFALLELDTPKTAIGNIDLPEEEVRDSNFISDQLPEGFSQLQRIKGMQTHPPKIAWGKVYQDVWNDRQKREYAEKLAYAMNHAADLAQQEKNEAVKLLNRKERQLIASVKESNQIKELLTKLTLEHNDEKQKLQEQIVQQTIEIKQLREANDRLAKKLKGGN